MSDIYDTIDELRCKYPIAQNVDRISVYKIIDQVLSMGKDKSIRLAKNSIIYGNSFEILNSLSLSADMSKILTMIITYSSLIHGTIDYDKINVEDNPIDPNSVGVDHWKTNFDIVCFLIEEIGLFYTDMVVWIVGNISYCMETSNGYPIYGNEICQTARNIVSDANKLKSLGQHGINISISYYRLKYPDLSKNEITNMVVNKCYHKLLNLHKYIKTPKGMELAAPLTSYIKNYVSVNGKGLSIGEKARMQYPLYVPIIATFVPNNTVHKFMIDQYLPLNFVMVTVREKENVNAKDSLYITIYDKIIDANTKIINAYTMYKNSLDHCLHIYICCESVFG